MRHREAGEYGDILMRYGEFLLYTSNRISEQLWQDASQHPALTRQDSRLQLASLAQQLKGAAAELRQVGEGLKEAKTGQDGRDQRVVRGRHGGGRGVGREGDFVARVELLLLLLT
jgi:hypothetical protein